MKHLCALPIWILMIECVSAQSLAIDPDSIGSVTNPVQLSRVIVTNPEVHAGYEAGRRDAERDVSLGRAFLNHGRDSTGQVYWDKSSGLPRRVHSGWCLHTSFFSMAYARAYDEYVLDWIATHGIPLWSRMQWLEQLMSAEDFFTLMSKTAEPQKISCDAAVVTRSPDRKWAVYSLLREYPPGATIIVVDSSGQCIPSEVAWGRSADRWEVCWGPPGADIAVVRFRYPRDREMRVRRGYSYFMIDLRTGFVVGSTLRKRQR